MQYLLIIISLSLFTSCSSMKKTIIYSSLTGALAGASAGTALSPNPESRGANAAVFGAIGAGVAALTGYALYKEDPRNYKLRNMLIPPKDLKEADLNPNELELGLGQLKINAILKKEEAYKVPVKELPKELKGKVNQQFLIKYQSKERYIKKNNKTYYIPSFQIFEHAYGDNSNFLNEAKNAK